ncbi:MULTISPECIES: AAA family ATPase [Nostocales]|uniref:ATP-binding protein n=3 Tax=Nostocales TaxID=1161 RepID=A0A0C1R188_9CYAN|nr:ATP-binding protein [Tolypothrix bouteillei]KAF3887458.1 ATP-binding protein [Tolypothrix bouteillei VB521301]
MLIEFSVGNYRSFKDKVTLSMVATNIAAQDKKLDENNLFTVNRELKLLKSAAIYGANASGKSNLAKALNFMRWFMINSSKETQSTEKIGVEKFRLSTETEAEPSFFEIVFLLDGQRYRYGFEADRERVISEWLLYVPKIKETKLFVRDRDNISFSKKFKADGIQQKTRHNALFISVCAQFNVEIAERILDWLTRKIRIVSSLDDSSLLNYTVECLIDNKNNNKEEIIQLIKKLDLGISDIKVEKVTLDSIAKEIPDEVKRFLIKKNNQVTSINTVHRKFDSQGNHVSTELFNLDEQESEGTQKIFAMAGAIVDTLKDGKVLIVDELDTRLHVLISRAMVELFSSTETNSNNAQLIFMTHDTNLLSNKLFRRDQIWFTEKNKYGATDLYSLVEFKLQNDTSFENDYIKGRYGAIPFIGNLISLINESDA